MDQKKIGAYIKHLRIKNNLSQSQLAEKLSVTNQAISKWENGRGIPDIEMLRQLSEIFNVSITNLVYGEEQKSNLPKNRKKRLFLISGIIVTIIVIILLIIGITNKSNFEFNTIASDNDKFSIKGVIAYNKNKKSIYISDIKYSADDSEEEEYVVAECILYESVENSEKKLSQCGDISKEKVFDKNKAHTLSSLLRDVEFNIDNYSCNCDSKSCNNLYLKINAINTKDKIVTYNIPIQIDNKCTK